MIDCWSYKMFVYRADYGASWTYPSKVSATKAGRLVNKGE